MRESPPPDNWRNRIHMKGFVFLSRVGLGEAQEQRYRRAMMTNKFLHSLILCSIAATAIRCDVRPHGCVRQRIFELFAKSSKESSGFDLHGIHMRLNRDGTLLIFRIHCEVVMFWILNETDVITCTWGCLLFTKRLHSYHNNKLGSCLRAFLMKNVESFSLTALLKSCLWRMVEVRDGTLNLYELFLMSRTIFAHTLWSALRKKISESSNPKCSSDACSIIRFQSMRSLHIQIQLSRWRTATPNTVHLAFPPLTRSTDVIARIELTNLLLCPQTNWISPTRWSWNCWRCRGLNEYNNFETYQYWIKEDPARISNYLGN